MSKCISIVAVALLLGGCASTAKKAMALKPGMPPSEVIEIVGNPVQRSFRGSDEAWQYQEVVGFGQCGYTTVWISGNQLTGVTSRRGFSAAGCGLGSRAVDWEQMPASPRSTD